MKDKNYWTQEKREQHIANREDSNTWDVKMFKEDLEWVEDIPSGPFNEGVFPVPRYDLHGNFTGVGSKSGIYQIGDKTILMNSFFSNKNEINEKYLDTLSNEIFFHIIVLTDTVDTVNYSHLSSIIISRNHPDYLGQGFYKTKTNQIDYTAFITAERDKFAIVNTRLFDLNFGQTILIAPQKDKSLKSMQINSPKLQKQEIDIYTKKLLEEQRVIDFFENGI